MLDRAQVLFVRASGILVVDVTLSATPERLVYDIDPAQYLRALDFFSATRRLWPVTWPQLQAQRSPLWWRTNSDTGPRVWAPLGTTHYVLYPAVSVATGAVAITMRAQKRPAALSTDEVAMEIPDEFFPVVLDFAEAVILMRQRDPALPDALARIEPDSPETEEVA